MAWDESAALAFAEKLLPPDAKSQGTVRTDQGTVLLYSSAALASAFDPRFFQNADGSAAQPGTLQLRCQSPNASTLALGQCIVSLGGV
jgi:hypothetical protein